MDGDNADNLFLFGGDVEEFYSEEAMDANREVAARAEVEEELKRLRHWEDQIAIHEEHAKTHIENEIRKAEAYLQKATKTLKKRAEWHRKNVEWWLRRQPDSVRSEKFINGTVKRRKGRDKLIVKDEVKAEQYLAEKHPHLLRDRAKNWKEIDKRELLKHVRISHDPEVEELFSIEVTDDSYTVETEEEINV